MTKRAPRVFAFLMFIACGDDPTILEDASVSVDGGGALDGGSPDSGTDAGANDDGGADAGSDSATDAGMSEECGDPGSQDDFDCTMVIGFSQTSNWYGSDRTVQFEGTAGIVPERWQLLWHAGAGVENWADPTYEGWDPSAGATQLVSRCAPTFAGVDRVVLTISSNIHSSSSSIDEWAMAIADAVATVRDQVPSAARIVLQPVVASAALDCGTRAEDNRPFIEAGIERVVASDVAVFRGAYPVVDSCADFADDKGHIAPEARGRVAEAIGACYLR